MGDMILFPTTVFRDSLCADKGWSELNADLEATAWMLAEDDEAGQAWCEAQGYDGYTSYGSLDDLPQRATCFGTLGKRLQKLADGYAAARGWDLAGRRIVLDNIWVNILAPGGGHSGHIHPHSVISGTYYVDIPDGASSLRFEDPRLAMMMSSPAPLRDAPEAAQRFVHITPKVGDVVMWESWLRHEVTVNRAEAERISVSFNYAWR